MRRRLLVLAAIFGVTYLVASATAFPTTAAAVVTIVVGFGWILARDVRRTSWAESQRAQDAAYAAAAVAALHTHGQSGSDCPTGLDGGFSGGCDAGGGI